MCCLPMSLMHSDLKMSKADGDLEIHDVSKEFPGATGEYIKVDGIGNNLWKFQCFNVVDFFESGTINANLTTGQLEANALNTSLQMYPMIRNGGWAGGDNIVLYPGYDTSNTKVIDFLCSYPAGRNMTYDENAVGTGSFTCSGLYNRVNGGQSIHPGTNCATVTCFFAPKAGDVYVQDMLHIDNAGSDGICLAIYHQPAQYTSLGDGVWGGNETHGLFGATPIFPQNGVNMSSDYQTGWAKVPNQGEYSYITDNFHVETGDMIAFIYAPGNDVSYDLTYTAPKVIYGTRPDAIEFNENEVSITIDEQITLLPTITPATSASKTINWSSRNTSIATVENGVVKGVSAGETYIDAELQDGVAKIGEDKVVASIKVIVVDEEKIEITNSASELRVEQGYEAQLKYEILPKSSSSKPVTWSIVDGQDKISLSSTGLVKALLPGTAHVKVQINESSAFATAEITVTQAPAPFVSIEENRVSVEKEETVTVKTTVTPLFHKDMEVNVQSANADIATASWTNGVITITGVDVGETTISVSVSGGNSLSIAVTVLKKALRVNQWSSEFSASPSNVWRYAMLHEGEYDTRLVPTSGAWGFSWETKAAVQGLSYVPQTYTDATQYFNIFGGQCVHPTMGYAAAVGYVAPTKGTIDYLSHFVSQNAGSSQQFKIMLNNTCIYPINTEWQVVDGAHPADIILKDVEIEKGDVLYTIVDCHTTFASDYCFIDPIIRYTNVELEPDAVRLNHSETTINVGDSIILIATITPIESQNKELVWTSSDTSIATVNQFGEVEGVKAGVATITATLDGGAQASCVVTVRQNSATPDSEQPDQPSSPDQEEPKQEKKGCKGSVIVTSNMISITSLLGFGFLLFKKKEK